MSVSSVGYFPVSPTPFPMEIHGTAVKQSAQAPKPEVKVKPQVASTAAELQRVFNRKLQFVVDQDSRQVIVKVIDKETDKVIKVLPPEELQRLYRNLKEAIGLLFDELV